jgi:hypothetical protein
MTPQEARQELLTKSLSQIHEETAQVWATRALEAKRLFNETGDTKWAVTCCDLAHEALEHSALVDKPGFFETIRATLKAGGAA